MTEEERDNTRWNVIEVETAYNVPQSAKLVFSCVAYSELPMKVARYIFPQDTDEAVEKIADNYRGRWNTDFEWQQQKGLADYWMGCTASNPWYTYIPRKQPTCDLQVGHYLFFHKVD